MSFNFSFSARTAYEARSKLHDQHAPAAVKALIEKALDAIPASPSETDSAQSERSGGLVGAISASSPAPKPSLIGVFVEVWGHIADAGSKGTSEIPRFIVKPLYG